VVANTFKELGLIEQWGSGINRIKTICKANGLQEPRIEEQNDFVDVELYRMQNVKQDEHRKTATDYDRLRPIATDYDQLEIEEKKVLLYLLDNEKITRKEALELLGYGETKTKEILKTLLKKDLIERYGQGRNTHYKLSKTADEM